MSAAFVLAGAGSCAAADSTAPGAQQNLADSTTVVIDNSATFQVIDGFGANSLSLVYGSADYLGPYRQAAIEAAFSRVGLSRTWLNLGVTEAPSNASDPFGQRANDNADPAVMNAAGYNFAGADAMHERVVVPARAFGYPGVDVGPLLNLRGPLDWLVAIRGADYARYLDEVAENVLAVAQRWRDTYGLTPTLLDLFNEPTSGNRELQTSSTQEVVDVVAHVGRRLRAAGFGDVRFVVPNEESPARSLEVARAILADTAARPFVGVIGYHPYPQGSAYASPRRILEASGAGNPDAGARQEMEQLKALGAQYGVPVWMTEVSEGPGIEDYPFDAIEPILARAIHIHDNFEYAGASAFFGMNTIWDSHSHEDHFAGRNVPFSSSQSDVVLADMNAGRIFVSPMGYAIGQYARWVKPGARRIAATSDNARAIVTAFRDPAARRLIVVVVNTSLAAQTLHVALRGGSVAGAVTGEYSAGTSRWEPIADFPAEPDGSLRYTALARSVTTLAIPLR